MASGNDALKKHHFWILAGAAPVLVLLAVVFMMTGVSGAIDTADKEITTTETAVKSTPAPGVGVLQDLDKKKEILGKVRGELWKLNWDKQEPFFTWPESSNGLFDQYNTKKFGTFFRDFSANASLLENFKPAYTAAYTKLGDSIAPTTFKGGWSNVLRWVRDWGVPVPDSRQLWLVMEDVWIQRALLQPIKIVNTEITRLDLVRPEGGGQPPPKKRKFVSHIWEIDLEVAPRDPAQGGGQVLKGKIKNRTNQLQVLGTGSAMLLKVWFDAKGDLQPFEFRIEGAGVAGAESMDVPPLPTHAIPPGTDVVEIAKVEQVLDKRTVPIRRLDRLAIGYASAKDFSKPLLNPAFWPDAAATDTTGTGTGGNGLGSGPPPGMDIKPLGGAAADPTTGMAGTGPGRSGGMRLTAVADANRKRYVETNEQLRRVPVAFTLVVDQMYVNDVLVAYANSPLRFEAVQYHWQRFTESLTPAAGTDPNDPSGGGSSSDPGNEVASVGAFTGAGLSSQGPPPGMFPGSSASFGPGAGFGGSRFGGIPGLGAETLSSVSEAQANSGLIQLTIYGIVTLYERYDAPKKEGEAPTTEGAKPAEAEPMKPDAAAPMTPVAPADPMKTETPPVKPMTPAPTEPAKPVAPAPTPVEPAKPVPAPTTTPAPPAPKEPAPMPPK